MEKTLKVNASKIKDAEGKDTYERSLTFDTPDVLLVETVADLTKIVGEDYVLHQAKSQMKIAFRGKVRAAMEKKDDNNEFECNDDHIRTKVYDKAWTPELRVTKTAEEKIDDALSSMDQDKLEAYLAERMKKLKADKKKA